MDFLNYPLQNNYRKIVERRFTHFVLFDKEQKNPETNLFENYILKC